VVLAAVATVATALVVGLTVSIWQAVRARNAEQAAREKAALAVADRKTAVEARRAADQERERADRQRVDVERLLYVANMNLVLPAWEQNNLGRVRQLLEETAVYSRPHRPIKDDHYGWVWNTRNSADSLPRSGTATKSSPVEPEKKAVLAPRRVAMRSRLW